MTSTLMVEHDVKDLNLCLFLNGLLTWEYIYVNRCNR